DENSTIVITHPAGGGGFSPPGSTPPSKFFKFFVAPISIAFSDSIINLNNWTSAGGWGTTTQKYTSTPNSATDSPSGNYPSNNTATLTLNDNVNLNDYIGAELVFQTQWDIETDWDYGQALISTNNGSGWIPLQGMYTNPGTGSFQPNGEPLYDGAQTSWVKESIDISSYIGEQVKFRFLLKSDNSVNEDGWYVDDINLVVYEQMPTSAEPNVIVNKYLLEQNYPNPFNPSTIISYQIPEDSFVSLTVFDVLGNEVASLVNENKQSGSYEVMFNASTLPSGVYFYTLAAGEFVGTKKMLLIK
ncbi:MAG: T9SS type A sorting domain-containing protein, partial [Ignavibacteriaceae bacterium]|nr:immune inhibitor A [Ignavibacteria bacterium]NNJ53034.1 T9SS type A sorting domain-containing protein [Ignavibacteriaceae bacterium]